MPFTARIFRHLESEMNRNLGFSYTIERNLTRPDSRTIRPGDTFRLRFFATNGCSLRIEALRGTIRPTRWVQFKSLAFRLPALGAHEQAEVGTADAVIVKVPERGSVFDQLATIDVHGRADLSAFRFSDSGRPATYSRIATATPRRGTGKPAPASRWIDAFDGSLAS